MTMTDKCIVCSHKIDGQGKIITMNDLVERAYELGPDYSSNT